MKTIEKIKEKHKVPDHLKEKVKSDRKVNSEIIKTIKEKPRTIPQIAEVMDLKPYEVTYYLMTLLKYGKIEVGEIDDMDEYYYYKIKDKQ